jgi:uncharacterized hydrophobic protein (TIGR00271 family)
MKIISTFTQKVRGCKKYIPNIQLWKQNIQRDKFAQEAAENLISGSRLQGGFFVMCGFSSLLATLGIMLNDIPILIAAMVLAPILNPVLALAAGVSLFHRKLIFYALKSFFGGVIFVILISALFIKICLLSGYNIDITLFSEKFREYNIFLFISAFISGFSGVYAWLRPSGNQLNLIGVAIAVSLIPFVSFFGILLGMGLFKEMQNFATPFGLNLLLIIFGSLLAFLGLGFHRAKKEINNQDL